jgi:hypothetical protein
MLGIEYFTEISHNLEHRRQRSYLKIKYVDIVVTVSKGEATWKSRKFVFTRYSVRLSPGYQILLKSSFSPGMYWDNTYKLKSTIAKFYHHHRPIIYLFIYFFNFVGWDEVPRYCGHFWPIVKASNDR